MVFVKMLTMSAGPNGVFPAGAIREVSDDEGKAIIDGRFGERVVKPNKAAIAAPETASIEPSETAVLSAPTVRKFAQRGG